MIRLDTTTRKIQALLGGSVTTNQMQCVSAYSDATNSGYVGKTTVIDTNDTTAVDIVPAPAAGVRDVDYINIYNRDTVSQTLTVRYNDNGTTYGLIVVTLLTGEQLNYTHGTGWCALDVNGNRKEAIGPIQSSSILGTTTNNNAAAGVVGEVIEAGPSAVNAVSLTTSTGADIQSLPLTAGDWDVSGYVVFDGGVTTNITFYQAWFSTTSATPPATNLRLNGLSFGSSGIVPFTTANIMLNLPTMRYSLSGATTVYMSVNQGFTVSTLTAGGYMWARRAR